jgi:signal peptidase I
VLKWLGLAAVVLIGLDLIVLHVPARFGAPHAFAIPSSTMAPTLHCARPAPGCAWASSDRVLTVGWGVSYGRGDVVVFETPPRAVISCGSGGLFIKRIVGLPGETVQEKLIHGRGYIYIGGRKLEEPYVKLTNRDSGPAKTWKVPSDGYFVMGDNRATSCDSRFWGAVPKSSVYGKVVMTYWPLSRASTW